MCRVHRAPRGEQGARKGGVISRDFGGWTRGRAWLCMPSRPRDNVIAFDACDGMLASKLLDHIPAPAGGGASRLRASDSRRRRASVTRTGVGGSE